MKFVKFLFAVVVIGLLFAGGFGYGDFKKRLFAALWEHFAPARARRAEIESDPKYIDEVLRRGAARANELANVTLRRVRQAMGL